MPRETAEPDAAADPSEHRLRWTGFGVEGTLRARCTCGAEFRPLGSLFTAFDHAWDAGYAQGREDERRLRPPAQQPLHVDPD